MRINLTAINGRPHIFVHMHFVFVMAPYILRISRDLSSLTGNFDSDSKLSNEWREDRFLVVRKTEQQAVDSEFKCFVRGCFLKRFREKREGGEFVSEKLVGTD